MIPYNLRLQDVAISSSGDNTVIAATTGRSILVWSIWLENEDATTDVNVVFKDGTTALNGTAFTVAAGGGGWSANDSAGTPPYRTSPGNAFKINLSGAQSVTGQIKYALL